MASRHTTTHAAYLVLLKNNKVLMHLRQNSGYMDGKYGLIAGHVEPGESLMQCMVREAQEEAGIKVALTDLQVGHVMHRNSPTSETFDRLDIFFMCTQWEGEITNMEPKKCGGVSWFSLDQLPDNTIPYIKTALEHIQNGQVYSEVNWR